VIDGKGVLNNMLSEFFMTGLNSIGVPNHFIRSAQHARATVRAVEIIPLEVIVRNYAAGSMAQRLGIEEGTALPRPIVEFYLKDDALGDPLVTEEHIIAFGWASQQDLDDMVSLALRVNDFLSGLMLGVGIRLVDFKIEIGRIWDGDYMRLIVADEISPDSCRLWDIETGQKLDKDVFRRDLGDLADAYTEVARRLGVMPIATCRCHQTHADQLNGSERMFANETKGQVMKAVVTVMLKRRARPAGRGGAPRRWALGFDGVEGVRQGKVIELDLAPGTTEDQRWPRCARSCSPTR
jgi:phosphoribosylaminoimidazole-succinocarboxamide synthase